MFLMNIIGELIICAFVAVIGFTVMIGIPICLLKKGRSNALVFTYNCSCSCNMFRNMYWFIR